MKGVVAGVGGTLLPDRYVARHLLDDVRRRTGTSVQADDSFRRWWQHVSAHHGPTSSIRGLFDDVAMPLCARLGFSAHDVAFDDRTCRARLLTPAGTPVALLLTSWARRPSSRWADLARHASDIGATWGLVLSPPFLSIVPALGTAARESIDVALPVVVETHACFISALAHAARFDPSGPAGMSLDDIVSLASMYRDSVRTDLQRGVETALGALVPAIGANAAHPGRAASGRAAAGPGAEDEALTIVFRILFLLFAESRGLVPNDTPVYARGYTLEQLCRDAIGGRSDGQWDALGATSRLLRMGCQTTDLRVEPFNGALFARRAAPGLEENRRRAGDRRLGSRDEALRRTLVVLGSRATKVGLENIDYRDLGVEQLGAVYERVLDLDASPAEASVVTTRSWRHSRRRRETGTFYTPEPLAAFLVRRTLAPLVDGQTADRILQLRVLDPAMGSGAFLVASCRYLASALEQALIDEGRLSPDEIDDEERARLRRQVAERCLAGVDRNGTAVQLARLSLWLTTLARDRPLGFLDHHLRTGNSLVGAWPTHLAHVPTRARVSSASLPLLELDDLGAAVHAAVAPIQRIFARPDEAVADVHAKAQAWRSFQSSTSPLHGWRQAADLWCARWFIDAASRPPDAAETRALVAAVVKADRTLPADHVRRRCQQAAELSQSHGFFHWPLEFPGDFYDEAGRERLDGGFDAIVGNPPWEMVRRDDGTCRLDPAYLLPFVRQSGQYPSCATGHLNLYQAFIDRALTLTRPGGRIGLVVPWGLASDDGTAAVRRRLFDTTAIDLIVGLDNAAGLFSIHRGVRMAILTASTARTTNRVRLITGIRHARQLDALPERGTAGVDVQELAPSELRTWTGALTRVPDVRRPGDLPLLRSLVARHPRLGASDGWAVSFGRELNATAVRDHLRSSAGNGLPVVEGKNLAPFRVDVSAARRLPAASLPRTGIADRASRARLGYRDVSAVGNRLTLIAAVIPAGVVTTHTVFCLRERLPIAQQHFLCACLNSYVVNAIVRMLMGGHVTTTLAVQLPVPRWRGDRLDRRLAALARQLASPRANGSAYHQLQGLAARRLGLTREQFADVLDGFPLVPVDDRRDALLAFERSADVTP